MHEGVGIERLGPALGRPEIPGGLEERHETGIVERQDRFEPVFGRGPMENPSSVRSSRRIASARSGTSGGGP